MKEYKNFLIYGSGQLVNLISPLLVAPKVIEVCGINNWGKIGVATSIFFIINTIIDFGSNLIGIKNISINIENPDEIKKILNETYFLRFFILLISIITLLLLIYVLDKNNFILYLFGVPILVSQFFNPIWYFQGNEKFKDINKIVFYSKIIYLSAIFLFVSKKENYIYMLLILGISNTIIYFIYFIKIYIDNKLSIFSVTFTQIKSKIQIEYPVLISNLAVTLYTDAPILIVNKIMGDYSAGIYKIGEMILKIMRSYLSVFFSVSLPRFSKEYSVNKKAGIKYLKKVNTLNMILVLAGLSILNVVFYFSNFYFSGKVFEGFFFVKKIIWVIPIIAMNIPFYHFLVLNDMQKAFTKIKILGAIIMYLSCNLLTKKYGLNGSVISLYFVEITVTSLIILKATLTFKNNEI